MRSRQSAIHGDRLTIDIRGAVAQQKTGHFTYFAGFAVAFGRVDLTDALLGPFFPGTIKDRFGHAGFDQTGTDRIDTDACAMQLIGSGLGDTDHTGLTG